MTHRIASLAACLLLVPAAFAADAPAAAPAGAMAQPKAPKVSKYFAPGEFDWAKLLPAPPAAGTPALAAELAELDKLNTTRTPARLTLAQHDADVENVTAIAEVLKPEIDFKKYPATEKLFADLRNEDSVAATAAKNTFKRPRPWELDTKLAADPQLKACDKGASNTSFPSGHATMGYAAGNVLAQLMPSKAKAIAARTQEYAESRIVCSVHYHSDINASKIVATTLVNGLMTKPEFKAEFAAAKTELAAAHLAP